MSLTRSIVQPVTRASVQGATSTGGGAGFAPSDIDGLVAQYQANDVTGSHGDLVSTWTPETGPAVTASGTDRPTLMLRAFRSHNGIAFFGTQGMGDGGTNASLVVTGDVSVYFFGQTDVRYAEADNDNIFSVGGDYSSDVEAENRIYDLRYNNLSLSSFWEGTGGVNEVVDSTLDMSTGPKVVALRRDDSENESEYRIDDTTATVAFTNSATGGTPGEIYLGCYVNGTLLQGLHGMFAEFLVYNRRLTDAEDSQVRSYLNSRYRSTYSLSAEVSSIDLTSQLNLGTEQCLFSDGTNLWVADSDEVSRWTVGGSHEETVTSTPALTSWGGMHLYDGTLYMIRFSESVASRIYSFDPQDLASGATLVKTLSDLPTNGVNGLHRMSDGRWLTALTNSTSDEEKTNQIYILNSSFELEKTCTVPIIEDIGLQSIAEASDGTFFVSGHDDPDADTAPVWRLRLTSSDEFEVLDQQEISEQIGGIAIEGSTFWLCERATGFAREYTLSL